MNHKGSKASTQTFSQLFKNVLIIDSSIEEGIELTGPLDEWLNEISKDGGIKSLNEAPTISTRVFGILKQTIGLEWKIVRNQSKLVYQVASWKSKNPW